jgi:hypothetical protein
MTDSFLHFALNIPVTLCIADPEGSWDHEIQQGTYQTTSGQTFILPRPAVVVLNALEPRPGEEIRITRHWKGRTSDPVQWTVVLTAQSEKLRALAEMAQDEAAEPQDLTAVLQESIVRIVKANFSRWNTAPETAPTVTKTEPVERQRAGEASGKEQGKP